MFVFHAAMLGRCTAASTAAWWRLLPNAAAPHGASGTGAWGWGEAPPSNLSAGVQGRTATSSCLSLLECHERADALELPHEAGRRGRARFPALSVFAAPAAGAILRVLGGGGR